MFAVQYLKLMLDARLERARDSERGASAVEWVIITAILVALAGGIAAILIPRIKGKAESISFDTP